MMLRTLRQSVSRALGFGAPNAPAKPAAQPDGSGLDRLFRQRASYDAARTTDEFSNYWANADGYDADSAHSKGVRETLRNRARYEDNNNPYFAGIASTYSTDLVGIGPVLRMQTSSQAFNQMVELQWLLWTKATQFRRKLWCMAHAKHVDGEAFGVIRRNPGVKHPIKLDVQLYEAEQISTPYLSLEDGYIDGIKFDQFGNPLWYDVLQSHPGSSAQSFTFNQTPERIDADLMLHWFKLKRPGQHRGVPDCVSSLNAGAAGRRWREATLSAAERAALLTLMMQTQMTPDEIQAVAAFSTLEPQKGAMNFLPAGWSPAQMEGKFPTANHEQFHKTLINEQARPVSMPYNKAACDSSSYNYASGRLDHQTYYGQLDVERQDADDLVLDKFFGVWFDAAVLKFNWLGGRPEAIGSVARLHAWDWPKHAVADIASEAEANDKKLRNGSYSLRQLYSDDGRDFEDELVVLSQDYGVTPDEMRKILRDAIFNSLNQQASMAQAETQAKAADTAAKEAKHSDQPKSAVDATIPPILARRSVLPVNGHTNGATNGH